MSWLAQLRQADHDDGRARLAPPISAQGSGIAPCGIHPQPPDRLRPGRDLPATPVPEVGSHRVRGRSALRGGAPDRQPFGVLRQERHEAPLACHAATASRPRRRRRGCFEHRPPGLGARPRRGWAAGRLSGCVRARWGVLLSGNEPVLAKRCRVAVRVRGSRWASPTVRRLPCGGIVRYHSPAEKPQRARRMARLRCAGGAAPPPGAPRFPGPI